MCNFLVCFLKPDLILIITIQIQEHILSANLTNLCLIPSNTRNSLSTTNTTTHNITTEKSLRIFILFLSFSGHTVELPYAKLI